MQEDQLMHTKAGFSLVPVPGYLPTSNDLEQTKADQIIQIVNEEVTSTNKEMQVIMQGDNKHPHINKSGSFSRLRSFELNDMGFSLNKISPITFDDENPQTPEDCGIKGRAPTSTPKERSDQGHPSGPADSMPQGPAPTAPSSHTGGPQWAPPVNNQKKDHQDPPECNGATNGSTRAPVGGKGPGAAKTRNKASEPHPGTSSGTGPATQPADSSRNTIICSGCGKSGHWSRNCHYNFCDFCRVTTHSTHMCTANKHGPRSPVCIYCGKTNHSSAYCRYRPRDNWEELRNTPDALKSGNNGENSAPAARNQTGSTHHNNNKTPFSHIDGREQNQPNGGPHRPQHREQPGAAPRGQQMDTNPNFPPRRQQHAHFNEGFNRRYSIPYSLPQDLTTQWPVMLLVDPSSNWQKISHIH